MDSFSTESQSSDFRDRTLLTPTIEFGQEDEEVHPFNVKGFFNNMVVESKVALLEVVQRFHVQCCRRFRVVRSDKQRLTFKCTVENCEFQLAFNFKNNFFKPPSKAVNHTCATQFGFNNYSLSLSLSLL